LAKSKLQFWTVQILLTVGIIYLCTKISFLFEPIFIFFSTLFFPILISGFLFFIFNPIVTFAEKFKIPRTAGILGIYVAFIGLIALVIAFVGPILSKQIAEFFKDIPRYVREIKRLTVLIADSEAFRWLQSQEYFSIEKIGETFSAFITDLPVKFTAGIANIVGIITNIALTTVTVPFLLFYMLKDGRKMPRLIVRILPANYRDEGLAILKDLTKTLSAYIQGIVTVSLIVGTLSFIGFMIIGLPYSLLLAFIVAVTNIIPYVGPFLGATPAVIIGLFHSPMMALLAVVVIVVAQQIDSNLLSPLIIGKQLETHPATIIILLLVAGNLAGILGMILAVPVYAVLKTITLNIIRLYRLYRQHQLASDKLEM